MNAASDGPAREALRAEMLELLERHSIRRGRIVLASGKVSDLYIDCRKVAFHSRGSVVAGALLFDALERTGWGVSTVAGPVLGAVPLVVSMLAAAQAQGAPLEAIAVRKETKGHGTGGQLVCSGAIAGPGRVALVEDVVTSAGSAVRAIEALRSEGYEVTGVVSLIDRNEGGAEALAKVGLPLVSIFERSDLTSS